MQNLEDIYLEGAKGKYLDFFGYPVIMLHGINQFDFFFKNKKGKIW